MQKIHVNDTVKILTGRDRGKTGKVTQMLPAENLVVVEGVNKRYKHVKKQRGQDKGQRLEYFAPVHISNVAVVDPNTKKAGRVKFVKEGDEKKRVIKGGDPF